MHRAVADCPGTAAAAAGATLAARTVYPGIIAATAGSARPAGVTGVDGAVGDGPAVAAGAAGPAIAGLANHR